MEINSFFVFLPKSWGEISGRNIRSPIKNYNTLCMQTRLKKSLQTCGICYQKATAKGNLDSCSHIFCFQCIKSWAQIENTCPLCKVRFRTIERQLMRKDYRQRRGRKEKIGNQMSIGDKSQSFSDSGSGFSVQELTIALIEMAEWNPEFLHEFLTMERLAISQLLQNNQNI